MTEQQGRAASRRDFLRTGAVGLGGVVAGAAAGVGISAAVTSTGMPTLS